MKILLALTILAASPLICQAGKDCCPSKDKTEKKETGKEKDDSCDDKSGC